MRSVWRVWGGWRARVGWAAEGGAAMCVQLQPPHTTSTHAHVALAHVAHARTRAPVGGRRCAPNLRITSITVCATAPSRLHTTPSKKPMLAPAAAATDAVVAAAAVAPAPAHAGAAGRSRCYRMLPATPTPAATIVGAATAAAGCRALPHPSLAIDDDGRHANATGAQTSRRPRVGLGRVWCSHCAAQRVAWVGPPPLATTHTHILLLLWLWRWRRRALLTRHTL
jgi:hypothetical protein